MPKLYRRVPINSTSEEKGRLPEKSDMYIVISDLGQVSQSFFSLEYKKFEKQDIIYWLEEVDLPSEDD